MITAGSDPAPQNEGQDGLNKDRSLRKGFADPVKKLRVGLYPGTFDRSPTAIST